MMERVKGISVINKISLLLFLAVLISCEKKCDDPYSTNFQKRGGCVYKQISPAEFGFNIDGQDLIFDDDPENGSIWGSKTCLDRQEDHKVFSWMNFNRDDEEWQIRVSLPIKKLFEVREGETVKLAEPSHCHFDSLTAEGTLIYRSPDTLTTDSWYRTDKDYCGEITISKVEDGRLYGSNLVTYITGKFHFDLNIDGEVVSIENGYFTDTPVITVAK